MSFFKILQMSAAIVTLSIVVNMNFTQAFYIDTSGSTVCRNTSVQCLSNNTYKTCVNAGSFTIFINTVLTCPDGYICNESNVSYPCTKEWDDENSDEKSENVMTTEMMTTTDVMTTDMMTTTDVMTTDMMTTTDVMATDMMTTTDMTTTDVMTTDMMTTTEVITTEIMTTPDIMTTTEFITTSEITTVTPGHRVVSPPLCKKNSYKYWPAAECQKYYVCIPDWKVRFPEIVYHSELRSCVQGKHFDTRYHACVPQDESDC